MKQNGCLRVCVENVTEIKQYSPVTRVLSTYSKPVFSLYISLHKLVFVRKNLISSLPCVLPCPQAQHTRVSDVRYTDSFSFSTMDTAHTSLYSSGHFMKAGNGTCSCWEKIFKIILTVQVEERWTILLVVTSLIQRLSNCGQWTVAGPFR